MDNEHIKALIEKLLESMEVSFESVEVSVDQETAKNIFVIKTKDQDALIGERGETFYAFAHLVRRMANKDLEHQNNFSIEVNNYQKIATDTLKMNALELAKKAADMKSQIEMEPASSYQRLIVHEVLKDFPHIKTESIGEGRERRIIIKYAK